VDHKTIDLSRIVAQLTTLINSKEKDLISEEIEKRTMLEESLQDEQSKRVKIDEELKILREEMKMIELKYSENEENRHNIAVNVIGKITPFVVLVPLALIYIWLQYQLNHNVIIIWLFICCFCI